MNTTKQTHWIARYRLHSGARFDRPLSAPRRAVAWHKAIQRAPIAAQLLCVIPDNT
jgi:hypothetical protein